MPYSSRFTQKMMTHTPKVVRNVLNYTPNAILATAMEKAFQQVFRKSIHQGDLDFFEGKCLHIVITDLSYEFFLKKTADKLQVVFSATTADVTFTGSGDNFLLLATQQVDPDTLFFQRKLKISGDTELSLEIKNFLASQDIKDHLPASVYKALKISSGFIYQHNNPI